MRVLATHLDDREAELNWGIEDGAALAGRPLLLESYTIGLGENEIAHELDLFGEESSDGGIGVAEHLGADAVDLRAAKYVAVECAGIQIGPWLPARNPVGPEADVFGS